MPSITIRRDHVGRFNNQNIITRFFLWLFKLPFRALWALVFNLYILLSVVLPSRRTAGRILFYQMITLSLLMNVFLFRQHYVIRCGYNYSVHSYFVSKEECNDQAQNAFTAMEVAREQFNANNQDLLK